MKSLIEGIEIRERRISPVFAGVFPEPVAGKGPEVLLITCSDPRLDPGLLHVPRPGFFFPIRTAGNIIPPYGAGGGDEASVEFAVRGLGIRTVVVCGHTDCGAMKAMLQPDQLDVLPSVRGWVAPVGEALPAIQEADEGRKVRAVVEANVRLQLENLKTHPCVVEALEAGEMSSVGAVYDLETGEFSICG